MDSKNNNEDILYAMQQRNLVYNYNFLNYSNQIPDANNIDYKHPDGWVYEDIGVNAKIGFDPQSNSCMIIKSNGNDVMTFKQNINEFPRWTDLICGKKVSACALIANVGTVDCQIIFSIYDGMNTSSDSVFFKSKEEKEINIFLDVSPNASTLVISIQSNSINAVLYIKKVFANLGSVALENLPCIVEGNIGERKQYMSTNVPPATELSLCDASVELSVSYTRLNSFLNGKFGKGAKGYSLLPDMRGYFSRAWDNKANIDTDANKRTALGQGQISGDNVGTVELDQFKEHDHELQFDLSGQIPAGPSAPLLSVNKMVTSNTVKNGGTETRSKNISELYTMKWA
ncbi:hypothetical protein [Flavobacterium reichenbachii]|uniref:Phage tail collar domain-containing protein n=1 Tax=Flavobacterium reichenbachii TaxID=362418 RepID=A0A085ZLK0_9FLAO|nr:hypothetical protein [Flavobacterium reichenbachii]KFF05314.1 hypothetical protein IW19_07115 [Flavobacterium reichenbachii]OXB16019.1 hypothetical protein B0A68_07045 [Flavobacterium reichenbachii]